MKFIPFTAYVVLDHIATHTGPAAADHFRSRGVVDCRIGVIYSFPMGHVADVMATEFSGTKVQLPDGYNGDDTMVERTIWFDECFQREGYLKKFDHLIFVSVSPIVTAFIHTFSPKNMAVVDQLARLTEVEPGVVVTVERRRTNTNHRAAELSFGTFYTYPSKKEKAA